MANAVLDGVDGILLGAETLRGKYPVDTVRTILDICRQAEKVFDHTNHFERLVHVRRPPCHHPSPLVWQTDVNMYFTYSMYAICTAILLLVRIGGRK